MTYLMATDLPTAPAGERFRALLARPGILQMPGTHNGMAALQARAAGFEALYLSGAAMSASMGLPDLGIITVDDVTFFIRQVARASGAPSLPSSSKRSGSLRPSRAHHSSSSASCTNGRAPGGRTAGS